MHLEVDGAAIHVLAELTLVLVLFTDAARIDLTCLRREESLPARLLGIGMPLTIAGGAAVAMVEGQRQHVRQRINRMGRKRAERAHLLTAEQ